LGDRIGLDATALRAPDHPVCASYTAAFMHGSPSQILRADAIVIGTGAGGAHLAARLADAGFDVIVLDAGPRLEPAQLTDDEGR
jgi:NADPH-dependent 2,4-dienoyl-CoA reductase/sulfur reductase-like enzyme